MFTFSEKCAICKRNFQSHVEGFRRFHCSERFAMRFWKIRIHYERPKISGEDEEKPPDLSLNDGVEEELENGSVKKMPS